MSGGTDPPHNGPPSWVVEASDPSALSTAQLIREIQHLRELLEARFEHVNTRFLDQTALITELAASIARRLEALDRLTDSKFVTHRTLLDSQADKVALALAAVDKAVSKADAATERRFESVNEFRQTLTDQAATFATRDQFETQRAATIERIQELAARVDRFEGRGAGVASSWTYLVGAISAVVVVVNLVIYVATR